MRKAESAINGINFGFSASDHHLYRAELDTAVTAITGNLVRVRVTFALRDSSGVIDDPYNGFVDVLVPVDRV